MLTRVSASGPLPISVAPLAYLAGLATGVWDSLDTVASLAGERTVLAETMNPQARLDALAAWRSAIARSTLKA
jgi:glycerol kinase